MKQPLLVSQESIDDVLEKLRYIFMDQNDPNHERIRDIRYALEAMLWSADSPREGEFEEGTMRIGVDHYVHMGEALAQVSRTRSHIADAMTRLKSVVVSTGDGNLAPAFTERVLYEKFEKDDARVILALIDEVARAAGLDPVKNVDRAANARLSRMVRYTVKVEFAQGESKDFVNVFREYLRPYLNEGDSVPRFSRPVIRDETGTRVKDTSRVVVSCLNQEQYGILKDYINANDNLKVVETREFYDL